MLQYDRQDRELLAAVNAVRRLAPQELAARLNPALHPHGIKELASPRAVRVAEAVMALLETFRREEGEARLRALCALRDEVLAGGNPEMRRNAARAQVQIMKELVRAEGDPARQLQLARDFRAALAGRPRVIRRLLAEHHLLEMPEDCPAVTFDDHVHDAASKGRKTPSHLLLDAWVKGVSSLLVVYYNFLPPEAARELTTAARLLGIRARAGIEFSGLFHGKYLNLIWSPGGFGTPEAFLDFLESPEARALMTLGAEVALFRQKQIYDLIPILSAEAFPQMERRLGVTLPRPDVTDFAAYVGHRQAALVHLADYVYALIRPVLREKERAMREAGSLAEGAAQRQEAVRWLHEWQDLDAESLGWEYLRPLAERFRLRGHLPAGIEHEPHLLREPLEELAARLRRIAPKYRLILSTAGLDPWDVPEAVLRCGGALTGLEIYNLKDSVNHPDYDPAPVNEFRRALNHGDIPALKRQIGGFLDRLREANPAFCGEKMAGLRAARRNVGRLIALHAAHKLKAHLGSDSAGRSGRLYGMGLAVVDTLPAGARRIIAGGREKWRGLLPVRSRCYLQERLAPAPRWTGRIPLLGDWLGRLLARRTREWQTSDRAVAIGGTGNIVSLGGRGLDPEDAAAERTPRCGLCADLLHRWRYLNSAAKNWLKVACGFVPAFLTFYLTRDWFVLAYGGALIWFGITGTRNLVQAVLGGAGLRHSPLLRWRSLIDPGRIADSLLYTGWSVPLQDYLVRYLFLEKGLGWTVGNHPVAVFAVMALVNGTYIAAHNLFRGLPRPAAAGNLFRSLLGMPVALALHALLEGVLRACGVAGAAQMLQLWAAVISKTGSDTAACVIEGLAERAKNLRLREEEYRDLERRLFGAVEKIALAFPDEDENALLAEGPQRLAPKLQAAGPAGEAALEALGTAALDLLYFHACLPRGRETLQAAVRRLTPEQRQEWQNAVRILECAAAMERLLAPVSGGNRRAADFYHAQTPAFLAALAPAAQAHSPQ